MVKKNICNNCKIKKLEQININMHIGIGYNCVGVCDICKSENQYLYSYSEDD